MVLKLELVQDLEVGMDQYMVVKLGQLVVENYRHHHHYYCPLKTNLWKTVVIIIIIVLWKPFYAF